MTVRIEKKPEPEREDRKLPTNITLRESMIRRLAVYTLDKYNGRAHMRNAIIERAVDELLKKEGY